MGMLASEDAAKAETHNRIERLCDPTHVRALPASEFDALFAAAALEVEARPGSTLDYEVGEWIEHGGPSEETATDIRRELEASIDPDRTGLHVRRERAASRWFIRSASCELSDSSLPLEDVACLTSSGPFQREAAPLSAA